MPRRQLEEDEMKVGRAAGILARKDPDLWEMIKRKAEELGVKPGDLLVRIVKSGIEYEEYREVDGTTIMKVMDILDRIFNYMNGWRQASTLLEAVEYVKSLEEITKYMAPRLGYLTPEDMKKIEEEIRKRAEQEIINKYRRTGRLGGVIDKFIDKMVGEIAEKVVEKIAETGVLEDIAKITAQATLESVEEEKHGMGIHQPKQNEETERQDTSTLRENEEAGSSM